jgi:DNA polymerase-3 subunit gamma/tau
MVERMGVELSVYRRWRPQRFSEVVGQPLVVETLRRAVAQGRLSHAYLFSGQRGVGKTSVARILARAVNCLAPQDGEPCNACTNCTRILSGRSLDVVEIDGASNRGIDQIRQLREEVGYVPAHGRYKVYIIDEVHMLTGEAFNALLKTLEEPPPHVMFIFATTEPHKVPATVLSRCQAFEFAPVPEGLIQAKIREIAQKEGVAVEPGAIEAIARRSSGSLRDAEVLLEQLAQEGMVTEAAVLELLGLPTQEEVEGFLDALLSRAADQALEVVEGLTARGRDLGLFLEEAAARARDRIIGGDARLIPLAQGILELRAELARALSRRLHLELWILALCGPPANEPWRPREVPPEVREEDAGDESPGEREEVEETWGKMLSAVLEERPAVAAFLAPARVELADGRLVIGFAAEFAFHYESLLEPEVWAYVEGMVQRFFGVAQSVHVEWAGRERAGPSLWEGAKLLAEALEGEILDKEEDAGDR